MLVLLSGGMDSTVALFHTLDRATGPVHALMFDYGQRHADELDHAFRVSRIAKYHYPAVADTARSQGFTTVMVDRVTMPRTIRMHGVTPKIGSLLDPDVEVDHYSALTRSAVESGTWDARDKSFIPHRNMLLMTIAAMYAHQLRVTEIVTGIRGGFPDCTPRFEAALQHVLHISNPAVKLTLSSPVHVSRADTIRLAQRLPGCMEALAHTMTCFEGIEPPCGTCLPCIKRAQGFAEVGIPDPLLTRLGAR